MRPSHHAVCLDRDGPERWEAEAGNLVTDAGARLLKPKGDSEDTATTKEMMLLVK